MRTVTQEELRRLRKLQSWAAVNYGFWQLSRADIVNQLKLFNAIGQSSHFLFHELSALVLHAESILSGTLQSLEALISTGRAEIQPGRLRLEWIQPPCSKCRSRIFIVDDALGFTDSTISASILSIAPDVVLLTKDIQGRITSANHNFAHLANKPLQELYGKRSDEIFKDKYGLCIVDHDLEAAQGLSLICVESVRMGGSLRRRVTIRFPLTFCRDAVAQIGVIGFDPNDAFGQLNDKKSVRTAIKVVSPEWIQDDEAVKVSS